MKRYYFCLIGMLLLVPIGSYSQTQLGLSFGVLSSIQENARVHYGGEVYAKLEGTENFRVGVSLGAYQSVVTTIIGEKVHFIILPIGANAEYVFLKEKFRPIIGISAGLQGNMTSTENGTGTFFQPFIAPVAGAEYRINENIGININVKYSFVFNRDESTPEIDFYSLISPNIGVFYKFQ